MAGRHSHSSAKSSTSSDRNRATGSAGVTGQRAWCASNQAMIGVESVSHRPSSSSIAGIWKTPTWRRIRSLTASEIATKR